MIPPLTDMKVTCPFGWRTHPVTGTRHFHNGIDLAAKIGTPVVAPFSGVAHVTRHETGGLQVIIESPIGLRAGFAHLSRTAESLRDGSDVTEGQIIAYSGNSGRVTGPHLHYTLAYTGDGGREFFDPERVIYRA